MCESLLKSHFTSRGYSETDVNALLGIIEIVPRRKSENIPTVSCVDVNNVIPAIMPGGKEYSTSNKRQKYSVNGIGAYYKNGSALELVKAYLKDNPSTYHTFVSVFNGPIPNYVISKEEMEIKERSSFDKNKTKRWHKDSPLVSSDGITFYVTTQVGDNCPIDFKDIVLLSKKLGYKIEPIL